MTVSAAFLARYLRMEDPSEQELADLQDVIITAETFVLETHVPETPTNVLNRLVILRAARLWVRRDSPLGMIDAGEFGWNVRMIDADYEVLSQRWRKLTWA